MKILALIPARMGSSRFPGKPMANLNGKPMIQHVYENVSQSELLTMTAVATCDDIIAAHIKSIGGLAVMTSAEHDRASDRCAEALKLLEAETKQQFDIVVMVQGDEPLTHPDMLSEALRPFSEDPDVDVVNLMAPIETMEEFKDPNCIKVVVARNGNALFMSRQPIPTLSFLEENSGFKQVCVIPFRRAALMEYIEMTPTALEKFESIDMLRLIENNRPVRMVITKHATHAVDTPYDLEKVSKLLVGN